MRPDRIPGAQTSVQLSAPASAAESVLPTNLHAKCATDAQPPGALAQLQRSVLECVAVLDQLQLTVLRETKLLQLLRLANAAIAARCTAHAAMHDPLAGAGARGG